MRWGWVLAVTAFLAAPACANAAPNWQKIDALFSAYDRKDRPGCAIGISRQGQMLHAKGFGMANLDWDAPNTPDTPFDIGSVTKQFTAFAILLLEARGKLSRDDDPRKYLPELAPYIQGVTIDQMMRHTSGIANYEVAAYFGSAPAIEELTPDKALEQINRMGRLEYPPGTQYSYSGSGYLLMARIVERVDGRPLPQFLAEEVFAPLGMKNTRMAASPDTIPKRAMPYIFDGERPQLYAAHATSIGEWGVMTTVEDMALWLDNLRTGKIGGQKVQAAMTQGTRLKGGEALTYGGGISLTPFYGKPMWRHNGGSPGVSAEVAEFPASGYGVSILCNSDEAPVWDMMDRIAEELHHVAPPPPGSAAKYKGLIGRYIGPRDRIFDIQERDDVLIAGFDETVLREEGKNLAALGVMGPIVLSRDVHGEAAEIAVQEAPSGVVQHYRRADPPPPVPLAPYAGRYVSPVLEAIWTIKPEGDGLRITMPDRNTILLKPAAADLFTQGNITLRFDHDAQGTVTGFTLNTRRAWNWGFKRFD